MTTYVSNFKDRTGEITTYDAMDQSLQTPQNSLYIAVKSFACYLMLKPVFLQLGEAELAGEAQDAVLYTSKGILSHWDDTPTLFSSRVWRERNFRHYPCHRGACLSLCHGANEGSGAGCVPMPN